MIDRQGGKIVWECDSCDSTFEWDDEDEFAKGWEAAKSHGWRTRKIGNEWVHACPDHVGILKG
jgi:hypothetical protein